MTAIKLKSIERRKDENSWQQSEILTAVINITVPLTNRISLDQDVTLTREDGTWIATVALDDFPKQATAELAADKLSEWLLALSKGIKGRNIKHLKLDEIFKVKHVR